MIVSIGCDHIVTDIKDEIVKYLKSKGCNVIDNGTYDYERTHYPIYGKTTAEKVVNGEADFGIVICGTGVGITNAANKIKGARAALVRDVETVKIAREKYNINILGMGGRITGIGLMENIIDIFLNTKYKKDDESEKIVKKVDSLIENDLANGDINFFDEFIEKWEQGEYKD